MNIFFTVLLIGISLAMDAFSLALIYGMQGLSKKNEIILSIIVGLFHFFMPIFGMFIGNIIINYFKINFNYLISIIFIIIGLEMIISNIRNKDRDINLLNGIIDFLLFGFSVSVDSFTTGIGIDLICGNYIFVSIVFMICSSFFTYIGLLIGNRVNFKYGNVSTIFGGIILLLIAIYYIIN